jgi:exopolysaccharide biosynthesis protein
MNMKTIILFVITLIPAFGLAQVRWTNMDTLYNLPKRMHVYRTTDSLNGKPNIAWYAEIDLQNRNLELVADTAHRRRLTPRQFYEKNNKPALVVNSTFFSFATNQNLNLVIRHGKMVGYNIHTQAGRGADTLLYFHPTPAAIGISKKRKADIAWVYADTVLKYPVAMQADPVLIKDSQRSITASRFIEQYKQDGKSKKAIDRKWKMRTAVGGGPVLVMDGKTRITNEEERRFYGKAIHDKHPRTAMGYTGDDKLIVLVVEGRNPGIAEGATLQQMADIFMELNCKEALNLDGGGSSCMLIDGKETIKPSDKKQRDVPAVFIVQEK